MNPESADRLVAASVIGLVLLGVVAWLWAGRTRPTGSMGSMMDGTMGTSTDPFLYFIGAALLAAVLGGGYLLLWKEKSGDTDHPAAGTASARSTPHLRQAGEQSGNRPTEPGTQTDTASATSGGNASETPEETELLELLPGDERRGLEPVIDSPGLTQIEIRDRSSISKSKVSQTLSALEKRDLIAREKQGRTYRVYPGEKLEEKAAGSGGS